MTTTKMMTIGGFARATGLTPGALRFYADSSILMPADTDSSSGYRYYSEEQIPQAVTVCRLREIGMPLDKIAGVLAGDTSAIDEHVDALADDARRARRTATELHRHNPAHAHLEKGPTMIATEPVTLSGPIFATAVDQIVTATAQHLDHKVLGGVNLEVGADTVTLTATDRFRLSTRTIKTVHRQPSTWTAVIDGDDLCAILPAVRRHHRVDVSVDGTGLRIQPTSDLRVEQAPAQQAPAQQAPVERVVEQQQPAQHHCRVLREQFPDYQGMLDGLPPVITRVVVSRNGLVRAAEDRQQEFLRLVASDGVLRVSGVRDSGRTDIPATVDGPDVDATFAMTTLYPALATAVGPDVMLDFSAPHTPVVIRSADDGDLTTLAMPVDREAIERGAH